MSYHNRLTLNVTGRTPVVDSNAYHNSTAYTVEPQQGASSYNVQLEGSMDGTSWVSIGYPFSAVGVLTTTIGPVTNSTGRMAYWNAGPYRFFRFNLVALNAGILVVNLACE